MRLIAALLTVAALAGCGGAQTQSEQALIGKSDEMRHRLAIQDALAILQGMEQARELAQQLARTTR